MSSVLTSVEPPPQITAYRNRVEAIRERGLQLLRGGSTGIQVAADLAQATATFLTERMADALAALNESDRRLVEQNGALIAVGGSGRGEMAPFSDVDLLFLHQSTATEQFSECASAVVRDCWDAKLKLGHSVRTLAESSTMCRQDIHAATAMMESRLLWGDEGLFRRYRERCQRTVLRGRRRAFIDECLAAREKEQKQHGSTVHQLEPDVKRSLGGLRDVHLIRWLGFAEHGTTDIESLRLKGALTRVDARALLAAYEFLLKLRIDMHYVSGQSSDVLIRDEQLRIAEARGIEPEIGLRPVECFMRSYFRHSDAIADISTRFVGRHRRRPLAVRIGGWLASHRADDRFIVGTERIDLLPRYEEQVCSDLNSLLQVFATAKLNGVSLSPALVDAVKQAAGQLSPELGPEAIRTFLKLLGRPGHLGPTVRSLFATGLLDLLIPEVTHSRGLLQFNQYHSFTVDEHTLRAVEAAAAFEHDDGPIGAAYSQIQHKELLHLALLLHDLGKGFEEDHSEVGRKLAIQVAERFQLPEHQRETLVFLVHKHLLMSHVAFRRDISDPELLMQFSKQVGNADTLRMLYVLTAADLTAVGSGVFTDWKSELLTELFDNSLLILTGNRHSFHQDQRLERVREHVRSYVSALEQEEGGADLLRAINRQLDGFAPNYLSGTSPDRIVADQLIIRKLEPDQIVIEGRPHLETGTVDYRIIMHENSAQGCFHKMAGVLTAQRLEILSAHISTSKDGYIVDSFRVLDPDDNDELRDERIDLVREAMHEALTNQTPIEPLFRRNRRYRDRNAPDPISELPTRVVIDQESLETCTVIDIFAHDRPGLLYTVARTIYELDLSVILAKIATHFDQVVDVFYVRDLAGNKLRDGDRLREIRERLTEAIDRFEREGYRRFEA